MERSYANLQISGGVKHGRVSFEIVMGCGKSAVTFPFDDTVRALGWFLEVDEMTVTSIYGALNMTRLRDTIFLAGDSPSLPVYRFSPGEANVILTELWNMYANRD